MQILQVMAGSAQGGAERFFEDLTIALAREGLPQACAVRAYPQRAETLRNAGCRVFDLPFGGPFDLFTPWKLKRIASEFRPQVVMGWMNRASKALPSGPWVNVGRLGGYYDLKYYRKCRHLVCNTPDIRDHVVRAGWPPQRAHFIPNFSSIGSEPPVARQSFDTPENVKIVLILARLHPSKGIDVAIRALPEIPDAVLWIAGSGPSESELRQLSEDAGVKDRVRFLGWRDDRTGLLKAADLCIVPSRHEPFGNVVLNAWTHDVPLVAASSQGPAYLIRHGEDGLLVPIGDSPALASAARQVINNPDLSASLATRGRLRIRDEFSEEIVVRRYRELFEDICR